MWAATAWTDEDWEGSRARGWTVAAQLEKRRNALLAESLAARRREAERASASSFYLMTASQIAAQARDQMLARWQGGPNVVALLFALPDSEAIRTLDARGEYFDCRTGDTWDLFFPGYHKADNAHFEQQAGSRRVGAAYAENWFFHPRDFDLFRKYVEQQSLGRWQYSGGTDLVLVNGYLPERGQIIIDWESTITGSLTEPNATHTLTIAQVIERLTRDLEAENEDSDYGVGAVVSPEAPGHKTSAARDITVGALAGIAAALGKAGLGL